MASSTFEPLVAPLREDEQGAIRVGNTRVLLDLVIHAFRNGASPEAIVECYDALSLPDVYAVLTHPPRLAPAHLSSWPAPRPLTQGMTPT